MIEIKIFFPFGQKVTTKKFKRFTKLKYTITAILFNQKNASIRATT
jgi:hypothetical protein